MLCDKDEGDLSIMKAILRKLIKEVFKLNYRNQIKDKPWSKSTSTIGDLQLIIDATNKSILN